MIGERLRVARARSRSTLRNVAAATGVSPQMIKKYEENKAMPRSGVLLSMCEHLDVSMEWLLDATPLDFHSTETAPQGLHAKYWVRRALEEILQEQKETGSCIMADIAAIRAEKDKV